MDNPVVSVIMPVYKAEDYIEDSIRSVLNQTYKNIELLCINDASPDKSFEICKRIKSENETMSIVLIDNDRNMGQEYVRNLGVNKATGKYIIYLDSDDTLSNDAIEKTVKIAERENADIVLFTYSEIRNGKEIPKNKICINNGMYDTGEFMKYVLDVIDISIISCIGSKLYNRSFLKNHDIKFDKQFKYNEDLAYALTALYYSSTVYLINEPFYKYLIRENNSTMSSYRPGMFQSISKAREILKKIYDKYGIFSGNIRILYYEMITNVMYSSLYNEAKYGNLNTFIDTKNNIKKYCDFEFINRLKKKFTSKSKIKLSIINTISVVSFSILKVKCIYEKLFKSSKRKTA